jgi:uncharacterized membrane protein YfcA
MTDDPTLFIIVVSGVAFLVGIAKGGFGGLMGELAVPLMALVMPVDRVIGLVLPILMIGDLFAIAFHWRRWNGRLILLLLPGAVVGVTIGTLFITNAPTESLRLALGIIILIFAVYRVLEKRILGSLQYESRNWHGLLGGTITGFSSALAHTGGPPVSIYLLMQNISPSAFVATAALFFFTLNWIKVPYYYFAQLFDFQRLWGVAWVVLIVPLGAWFGRWISEKIDPKSFERFILVLLIALAVFLILT